VDSSLIFETSSLKTPFFKDDRLILHGLSLKTAIFMDERGKTKVVYQEEAAKLRQGY
jgi:hypothetical protein